MKFATKPIRHYPLQLRYFSTLPWEIKNSDFLQIINGCGRKCKNFDIFMRNCSRAESITEVEDDRSPEHDLLVLTDCIASDATMVDGVDDAAQLEVYSVDDWQPIQLYEARRDVTEST